MGKNQIKKKKLWPKHCKKKIIQALASSMLERKTCFSMCSGEGSGGARGANGPSNNSPGGAWPPNISPCLYYIRCCSADFMWQASFKSMLSEVHKLVLLYLTVPVTTSTAERSFSGLKRIKTCLRNSMRLNHCIILHIHRNKTEYLDC